MLTWLVFLYLSLIYYSLLETKKHSLLISVLSVYRTNRQTNRHLPSPVYSHGNKDSGFSLHRAARWMDVNKLRQNWKPLR